MSNLKVWINDKFVDTDHAKVSVFDRGFLHGDGLFETMRSYKGKVFRIRDHVDRFFNSFKVMRMKSPYPPQYLEDTIYATLMLNKLADAYIRMTITRGAGKFGFSGKEEFSPNVVIAAKEFVESPEHMYTRGISATIVRTHQNELSPVCRIKSLNFLNYILARFEAKDDGFDDAILKNSKGCISEAATSNIFIVHGKELITPSLESGILPGITRKVVLEIARQLRIRAKEGLVTERDLLVSDEVFLTNSLVELLPVVKIGSQRIGSGKPGHMTHSLHAAYKKQVAKELNHR